MAAGALSAVGSVFGGLMGGKGAKKAAKIQRQAVQDQIAATERNRDYQYNLNAPTIELGTDADNTIAGLLNIGGDPAKSAAALAQFRDSSGYQDIVNEGLKAVRANAYAGGMGDSGAAYKALQDRGASLANRSLTGYLGQLTDVANRGGQARGLVAGVGTNSTNSINQAIQAGADASGNAAIIGGNALGQGLQGLLNAGAYALGSSYGGTSPSGLPALPPPGASPGYGGGWITPNGAGVVWNGYGNTA
ncbi:hypothetical protein ACFSTI_29275 [Rhizorhabdus histidinilytica]